MEDEVNLIDYIKAIIRQKYTILGVILIGIIIATLSFFTTPKVYQATGYYKVVGFLFKPNLKQVAAEARIKYPSIDISIPKDTKIIIIKTTGATHQEAKLNCMEVVKALPLKQIVDISFKLLGQRKTMFGITIIVFILGGVFIVLVKEWWEKNKGEICGN